MGKIVIEGLAGIVILFAFWFWVVDPIVGHIRGIFRNSTVSAEPLESLSSIAAKNKAERESIKEQVMTAQDTLDEIKSKTS